MTFLASILIMVLSLWDYPARQSAHEACRNDFVKAVRVGDTKKMLEASTKGSRLFPEDPTWAYNKACSLAYMKNQEPAYQQLEKAIDLGFRDSIAIANDSDLKRLKDKSRLEELVKYAESKRDSLVLTGPLASVPAFGVAGEEVIVGEQNLKWDFDAGCYMVGMKLSGASAKGNMYDLYMNRDNFHSVIEKSQFPGLTEVRVDQEGRRRGAALDSPNMIFPYPVFGNCSRAFTHPKLWRSLPRSLMTFERRKMPLMEKLYLSNQTWVYPANADFSPVGTNGDCFVSVAPYWLVSAGASWSDKYYLSAALEISRSLKREVKSAAVSSGLLAPLIQAVLRRSLQNVTNEVDYFSSKAHPTCFPPRGLDVPRMKKLASSLDEVPPVARLSVMVQKAVSEEDEKPICLFATRLAVSFIMPEKAAPSVFIVRASGAAEYKFAVVHGDVTKVKVESIAPDAVKVTVDGASLSSRVDLAVFGRNKSFWGAPSFVSFAGMVNEAGYKDPMFNPPEEKK